MTFFDKLQKIFDDAKQEHLIAIGAVSGVLIGGIVLKRFFRPSKDRNYKDKSSVGDEYDQWTNDGILEHFWGEHIHHGYFGEDGKANIGSIEAKNILIQNLIEFASLKKVNGEKVRILDIGCGIGGSSRFLAKEFLKIGVEVETYGVTLSQGQVNRARELTKSAKLENNCFFQVGDALSLPFKEDFDIVWSLESGEHMPDKDKFVSEAYRVLKKGGKIMIATWCTKEEKELKSEEKKSLDIIYKEWALPFFVSLESYERLFTKLAIKDVKTADWSVQTKPTWSKAVWDGFFGMPWLLMQGPVAFYRTLKDVYAIWHMIRGFNNGYVVYGVICGSK